MSARGIDFLENWIDDNVLDNPGTWRDSLIRWQ
jgi:hypothetical protein